MRHRPCNELSTAIFPTARRRGPLVLRQFVRASRGMGVIWAETGMVWDANDYESHFSRHLNGAKVVFLQIAPKLNAVLITCLSEIISSFRWRLSQLQLIDIMAGVGGLEPTTLGFGDRCSTN